MHRHWHSIESTFCKVMVTDRDKQATLAATQSRRILNRFLRMHCLQIVFNKLLCQVGDWCVGPIASVGPWPFGHRPHHSGLLAAFPVFQCSTLPLQLLVDHLGDKLQDSSSSSFTLKPKRNIDANILWLKIKHRSTS